MSSVRIGATFVAEPLEPSLRFWLETLGLDARVEFAPYNQVFQELLNPASDTALNRGANLFFIRPEDWLQEQQHHATPRAHDPAWLEGASARRRLPNGVEVAELNRAETDHLYREIFQNRAYLRRDILLEDGAVVVDCGANIGMFSLFVHLHARDARILAIEPSPRTAQVLRANAALHGMGLDVFEFGLSDREGEAAFTFYENYSVVSGFAADTQDDERFLRAAIQSTLGAERMHETDAGVVQTLTDHLVAERLQRSTIVRPLRRLGDLLREQGVAHVDLLKIDVEKAELQVLAGIDEDVWPGIQQVVMEIHDQGDAIVSTVTDLERRGFRVQLEEERDLKGTGVWNIFAVRPEYREAALARQAVRDEEIARNVQDLVAATRAAATRSPALFAIVACPSSAHASARPDAEVRHARTARALRESLGDLRNVIVVQAEDLAVRYGCPDYYDGRADALGHMPYSPAGYAALATVGARALHAWTKPPTKVVVVDCDNTLWSGVCAEDGPQGIGCGASHRALAERLAALQAQGVLLALCSKNEEADVWAVFDHRPDFGLRREQFVAARINWSRKSENLRAIATELRLGLDSFVFIDDNPVECAEVRANAPGVTVLQWPTDSAKALRFLDHLWPLDIGPITDEDRKRTQMYQQEAERRRLRDASFSLEAFLEGLGLEVTIAPVAEAQIPRAAQLTERTNQFNFTTIRRTEDQLRDLIAKGEDVLIMHVKDRFGDYGLVGLAIARSVPERRVLSVDTFLMSCRVLGKGVEHRLLASLGEIARSRGFDHLELPYRVTARNRPALLFATSAFADCARADGDAGDQLYIVPTARACGLVFKPTGDEVVVEEEGPEKSGESPAAGSPFRALDYQRVATELADAEAIVAAAHHATNAQRTDRSAYAPPQTETEIVLARIWADLLHVDRVGLHDNFFSLGGDSIIAIQVLSRGAQAGLAMEMKDLFDHATVFELARAIATRRPVQAVDLDVPPGTDVALTPIQEWFFAKDLPAPHHWNMEMVVESAAPVDAAVFERAVRALVEHHEALRYRYERAGDIWRQGVGEVGSAPFVESVALPDRLPDSGTASRQAMAAVAARLHAGLDLANGPLIRAAICVPADGGPTQVVLVLHHLVSDGITWRIVLEDLEVAYGQITRGLSVALPPRSTSYRGWAAKLAAYAASPELSTESAYWTQVAASSSTPLRVDHVEALSQATERTLEITPSVLTAGETRALLQDVPQTFDTQINDVLLAALAIAYRDVFGVPSLLVDLEGHGREPLFTGVDLSRTVGWFTTVFPVRVDGCGGDLRAALAAARALRQAIPRRGIGYGVLRYLHPDSRVRTTLASAPQPEVMFNYLGQFDQALRGSSHFQLSPDVDFGPLHGPDGLRSHLFEIIGRVVGGRLRLDWMYSRALFDQDTVARLIARYESALRDIVTLAQQTRSTGAASSTTPAAIGASDADTPHAALAARFGTRVVQQAFGLAPIQELFLIALNAGQGIGLDQWWCTIEGALDSSLFKQAWEHVITQHATMRTAFVSEGPGGAVQAVLGDGRLQWHDEDLSALDEPARRARMDAYSTADRARGFDPLDPPLMRVALFRMGADRCEMLWTFHHLLIDGWSCPLVFAAVGEAYDAQLERRPAPPEKPSYGRYVEWLRGRDASRSELFWRRALAGFTAPTPLPAVTAPAADVIERSGRVSAAETAALQQAARTLGVSMNTFLQLAWALVLSRHSGRADVVFGVAFSGRPPELPDVEAIIGPFVNNLPVRVRLDGGAGLAAEAKALQGAQFELLPHQFSSLASIQRWSDIGLGARLFDSLLVLQSYTTAAGLRSLGSRLAVRRIDAPVRTSYPLTIVAEPGQELAVRVIANPGLMDAALVQRVVDDLVAALQSLSVAGLTVDQAVSRLSAPAASVARPPKVRALHREAPQPGLETDLVEIWGRAFGLPDIGVNETFTDLGGQSLLMLQVHADIRRALGRDVSIVVLFQHPTIRALAQHLQGADTPVDRTRGARERASRQSEALARQQRLRKRG